MIHTLFTLKPQEELSHLTITPGAGPPLYKLVLKSGLSHSILKNYLA